MQMVQFSATKLHFELPPERQFAVGRATSYEKTTNVETLSTALQ